MPDSTLVDYLWCREVFEEYLCNHLVSGNVMVLPVAGIQRVISVVTHHEVAVFRNFKMVSLVLIHRFREIWLVERCVGSV